jgi:hypothetical protein
MSNTQTNKEDDMEGYPKTIIISGEGEVGTIQAHTGKDSVTAIARRLTRERCNGDRWAHAWTLLTVDDNDTATYQRIDTGDLRHINMIDIDD